MTNIGDIIGSAADSLLRSNISIGEVHLLNLDPSNGITPKGGDTTRDKYFIILGFDDKGYVIGGLVINSKINYHLPPAVTDYQLPISVAQCPFLRHDSFVNCSKIIVAKREKFNRHTYRGEISDAHLLRLIIDTVKESPTVNKKHLKAFGIE